MTCSSLAPEVVAFLARHPKVALALRAGILSLDAAPGHFILRVDGGPSCPAEAELAVGVTFKSSETS